jgi:hypothetical protein
METTEEKKVSEAARTLGKIGGMKGGKARAEALTPEERRQIAQEAIATRWAREKGGNIPRLPKAIKTGVLTIGDIAIQCAVLEDGTRVLTQRSFSVALGRSKNPARGRNSISSLPPFLALKNLEPFISEDLHRSWTPIRFLSIKGGVTEEGTKGGNIAFGYPAELLPKALQVWLDADENGALLPSQQHMAARCKILAKGLMHVGIVALVDEATGYQEIRDKLALQEILDKFLLKEFAAWAKRFPDEFYWHIFRLRHWQWRGMKINRPQIVAYYTKDLVYARLAPGILKELEIRNPKDERGYRKAAHHQFLTEDIGHPALAQHVYGVLGLMRIADEEGDVPIVWDKFMKMVDKAYPRRGDTLQLSLFQDDEFYASLQGTIAGAK